MKRINPTVKTENLGIIAIYEFANEMGWIWRPTPNNDVGIDGELEIVVDGEATGKLLKVQIKSGKSYFKKETDLKFEYIASADDIDYWGRVNFPVILVVHNPEDSSSYALDVQQALKDNPIIRSERKLTFNKKDTILIGGNKNHILNACDNAKFSNRIFHSKAGYYKEHLHTNFFPLLRQPHFIYSSSTDCRTQEDIRSGLGILPKTPCVPYEGKLYTFANLENKDCSLRNICSINKIEKQPSKKWIEDSAYINLFVMLLNTCLRKMLVAKGLIYDRDKYRYYFRPKDGGSRYVKWQSLQKVISKPVVYPHVVRDTGEIDYWVHWASKFNFVFFEKKLYLLVQPCMVFSKDGVSPVAGEEMGKLSTIRSSHQYNRNVLGYLFFWKEFLKGGHHHIQIYSDNYDKKQKLIFQGNYCNLNAGFGIEGDSIKIKSVIEDLDDIDLTLENNNDDVDLVY